MSDVFESYEKYVAPTIPKPAAPEPPSEDELFHDDDEKPTVAQLTATEKEEQTPAPMALDYEKLADLVAARLKGGEG